LKKSQVKGEIPGNLRQFLQADWKGTEGDLQSISEEHERLISKILAEEEDVIAQHRQHIDSMVELVKHEMELLQDVDRPGSEIEDYVSSLDSVLQQKAELIEGLRAQLAEFHSHLRTEEKLSRRFYDLRANIE
jgi:kinesin family protein 2/24